MKLPSIKSQLIFFLGILAFCLSVLNKDRSFLPSVFVAVAAAILLDSAIIYLKTRRFTVSNSSVITGLIIGYVISSQEPWWKLIFASVFAITSKHLIRFRSKHLFNPAAFGIFSAIILLGIATQWRGANLWYVLVPIGIYFVWKINKLEIVGSFVFVFLILFGAHAVIQNFPLLDVLKYQNYFFLFIMLIEPKTSPMRRKGKIIFGAAAGILVFILTMIGIKFDAELASLLLLNPMVAGVAMAFSSVSVASNSLLMNRYKPKI